MENALRYICLECNESFDEPAIITETYGFDSPPYEQFKVCPFCSGKYIELVFCDVCDEPIVDEFIYIPATGDRICSDCYTVKNVGDIL